MLTSAGRMYITVTFAVERYGYDLETMAPNLIVVQRHHIADLIRADQLSDVQIAAEIPCTDRAIRRIRANLQCFGRPTAPCHGPGRPRTVTPVMMQSMCQYLESYAIILNHEEVTAGISQQSQLS